MSTILAIVLLSVVVVALPLMLGGSVAELLSLRLAVWQDMPLVPIFLCAALMGLSSARREDSTKSFNPVAILAMAIGAILIVGQFGHALVFHNQELSRDEQLAVFDQQIFAHGRLFWPIPVEWRPIADALNRRFMFPIGGNEYWVSSYLPMHSAFRALLGLVGLAASASAIMTAIAATAQWSIARRLWPQSPGTVAIGLVLLVTSSQVLITSMGAFSMSMHLALNLVWLSLFLEDRKWSHGLAVIVAFVATGIHQPLFHPLFALPFVALLAFEGRWRVLVFYVGAYSTICLFWLAWPLWIASHGAAAQSMVCNGSGICSTSVGFVARLRGSLTTFDLQHLWLTAANLIRFVCWQHPLLVPLGVFGAISCWRSEPLVRALTVCFLLPIVVLAIILPWQGHGWGYRYLHPVIGNAILLACYGLQRLKNAGLTIRRPLIVSTVAAVLLVAVHGWMAARIAAPFVQIRHDLANIPADVVIVDSQTVPYVQDVVLNKFDLSNRPILLLGSLLRPEDLPQICKRATIAFYGGPRLAPIARVLRTPIPSAPSAEFAKLRGAAQRMGCRIRSAQH